MGPFDVESPTSNAVLVAKLNTAATSAATMPTMMRAPLDVESDFNQRRSRNTGP